MENVDPPYSLLPFAQFVAALEALRPPGSQNSPSLDLLTHEAVCSFLNFAMSAKCPYKAIVNHGNVSVTMAT